MDGINLKRKLSMFSEHWAPRRVTGFNGPDVMVVKVAGEFNWHSHADTDDFFLVLSGELIIQMREGDVVLGPGEMYVVFDVKDVKAFSRKMEKRGLKFGPVHEGDGYVFANAKDPSNNAISISSRAFVKSDE